MSTSYIATASCTEDTKIRACVFVALGTFFFGWTESLAITMTTMSVKNQQELGTAGGAGGSIRFVIISVCGAVYGSTLSNRLSFNIAADVPPAAINAGLPKSSVSDFITALTTGSFDGVRGVTPEIIAAGIAAFKLANTHAFRTVFLSTIAFTALAVLSAFFLPNTTDLMPDQIAVTLHTGNTVEKSVTGKDVEEAA